VKIAIVSQLYKPFFKGGAEISSEFLARGLRSAGHEVLVISSAVGGAKPGVDEVDGVPVHRLRTGLPYDVMSSGPKPKWAKAVWHAIDIWNPTVFGAVKKLLVAERPDVLHTNVIVGLSTSVWTAARAAGVPVVHTLRDYYLLCVRSLLCKADGRICRQLCGPCQFFSACQRPRSKGVGAVVGISRFVLEKHREMGFFRDAPGHVIHNAVLGESVAPRTKPPGEPLEMLFMGTVEPYKGVDVVLNALAQSSSLPVRLHICGGGAGLKSLQERWAGDARVIFEGVVQGDRKRALIAGADVMVVPSVWFEPFGRTVIEGYQQGLAVVGSRIGGIPELIEDGVTGRLFEPGDSRQLRGVLEELVAQPDRLAAMKQAAAAKAQSFSLAKHAQEYLAVYKTL
jgi:glycosyltransferase involved in cell wall biosynthesis